MDDLRSDFIAETREMLDAIAGELVAWEANPCDRARLDAIFRFVHSVKGSCGFLDLPRLARLSHAAEDVLAEVRAGKRQPDAALVSAVLGIVDRIGELAQAVGSGESLPADEDRTLIAALRPGGVGPAPPPAGCHPPRSQTRTVRLPVELLDRIMGGVSDLVQARDALALRLGASGLDIATGEALARLSTSVAELQEAITRTRVQRLDQLFAALPRMVRDLSANLGRSVLLEVEGGDVELDREMIEAIRDPITHLIRNAIDHGIEPPDERRVAGKPPIGSLRVVARALCDEILIDTIDDGRGIDADRLVARAVDTGLLSAAAAAGLPLERKLALMFEPGVSTARAVTDISGRGVGMDVVHANVERIGGVTEVESRPGAGTRIRLRVPLKQATAAGAVPPLVAAPVPRSACCR